MRTSCATATENESHRVHLELSRDCIFICHFLLWGRHWMLLQSTHDRNQLNISWHQVFLIDYFPLPQKANPVHHCKQSKGQGSHQCRVRGKYSWVVWFAMRSWERSDGCHIFFCLCFAFSCCCRLLWKCCWQCCWLVAVHVVLDVGEPEAGVIGDHWLDHVFKVVGEETKAEGLAVGWNGDSYCESVMEFYSL